MALADLLRAFERETASEAAAIRARAAAEAATIAATAGRERAARIASATSAFAAAARAAMLARIREAVAAALPASVERVGEALLASALASAGPTAEGVVRCAPALVRELPRMRVEPDPRVTGAVIELASGTRIDATLDALLAREWPRLACEALALVGGMR